MIELTFCTVETRWACADITAVRIRTTTIILSRFEIITWCIRNIAVNTNKARIWTTYWIKISWWCFGENRITAELSQSLDAYPDF